MTGHILWYFDNSTSTPATQVDAGPFNPGVVERIFKVYVHGNMSFQSFATSNGWIEQQDLGWGAYWVPHGGAHLDIRIAASDDHWFWRHAVATNNDMSRPFAPSTDTASIQSTFSLIDTYRGQGLKPGVDIDVYVAFSSLFFLTTDPYQCIGSVDFFYE
jgi:hypothetical protein